MILTWMAYAAILGAVAAGTALALERIVEFWGGARRIVWPSAMLVSIVLPLLLAVRPVARYEAPPSADSFRATPVEFAQPQARATVNVVRTIDKTRFTV